MLARDRAVKTVIGANSQGSVEIHARSRQIQKACGTEKVWLSWNNAVPGSTLVTCDCGCTSHDNSGWLIEPGLKDGNPRVRRVSLGKVSSVVEFKRAGDKVQDIISSHPWCSADKVKVPLNAVFTTLMKQPSQSGDAPYCFTPHFFVGDGSAPLRKVPTTDDLSPDVPAAESAMVAREVERLRAGRPED